MSDGQFIIFTLLYGLCWFLLGVVATLKVQKWK